jgi:hypothetical protein
VGCSVILWEDVAVVTVTIKGVRRPLDEPHVGAARRQLSTATVLTVKGNLKELRELPA